MKTPTAVVPTASNARQHFRATRVSPARRRRTGEEARDRTIALFRRARVTPEKHRACLRNRIITLNLPLARSIASRYQTRGVCPEDLEQVAYEGLVKAVDRFDPSRGHDFSSFAVPTIRGEIKRYFRDQGWMIRPTRALQEAQARIFAADTDLYQYLGRAPRPSDIAEHLGLEPDLVHEALSLNGCFSPTSLDGLTVDGDRLGVDPGERDPGFDAVEIHELLRPLLQGLSARERRILHMRFLECRSQAEIGRELGVTQMQVSRLLSGILTRLRQELAAQTDAQPDSEAVRRPAPARAG